MTYAVKEIFTTLQGEGAQAGRAAVFCRFAGCNLWSGREEDRADAVCRFCDTDFVGIDGEGGGKFPDAMALARAIAAAWGPNPDNRYVVFTGGEPLLQLAPPPGIDWICVSPKAEAELALRQGDELKLVFPQAGSDPDALERLHFDHFWVQPMDGPALAENTRAAVAFCLERPIWRLSLQTHKFIGIP
jgi:organic radical activating enzyme